MAAFTGQSFPSVLTVGTNAVTTDLTIRQTFYNNIDPTDTADVFQHIGTMASGSRSNEPGIPHPTNWGGSNYFAYKEIFYNNIIIAPILINAGNVVTDTEHELKVYNAYFVPRTLNEIIDTNAEGIIVTAPVTPFDFGALQEITLLVTVEVGTGPPTIDASFLFDFPTTKDDKIVRVTGSRILALPYLFQAGLTETLSWSTKIITANNGDEQRMKLRSSPRREYEFNIGIPRNQIAQLDALMYGWRGNFFGLPISSECRMTDAPTAIDSQIIEVNTEYVDFTVGGLAMIYVSATEVELINIEALTTNSITSAALISKVYPTGTLIVPVRTSRLVSNPIRSTTGDWLRLSGRFQVTENTALPSAPSAIQYKGLDVYTEIPLLLSGFIDDTYDSRVDVVDYQTGKVDVFTPWSNTKVERIFGLQFNSLEEVWNYRLWLHRRAGKYRPFWMPTFEDNFNLISTGVLDVELEVINEGQLGLTNGRNHLAIETSSGYIFKEILAVVTSGNNIRLTVDTSINVDASTVLQLSYLNKCRLSTDNLEMTWDGNNTAKAAISTTALNN